MMKPFIEIDAEHFTLAPFDTKPLDGYEEPFNKETDSNFPYCCAFHEDAFEKTKNWFKEFPNCCSGHKEMQNKRWFNKNLYNGIELKTVRQLSYTEQAISLKINEESWYKDITDYIDYNVTSFGHPSIGVHNYLDSLKYYLENTSFTISKVKRLSIVSFIDEYYNHNPNKDNTDINLLRNIYNKWIKDFPFDLSLFSELRSFFERQAPFFNGQIETNQYTKLSKGKLHTKTSLLQYLENLTNTLLVKINTKELFDKGLLKDADALSLEVILKERTVTLEDEYLLEGIKDDNRFRKTLKKWLRQEKQFIDDIKPFIKTIPAAITEENEIKLFAKHYVLAYLFESMALGKTPPSSQKISLEKIGREWMPGTNGNTFYKQFNHITHKYDLNSNSDLRTIGGDTWKEVILNLTRYKDEVKDYLQSKGL